MNEKKLSDVADDALRSLQERMTLIGAAVDAGVKVRPAHKDLTRGVDRDSSSRTLRFEPEHRAAARVVLAEDPYQGMPGASCAVGAMFELEVPLLPVVNPSDFLIEECGWPPAFAARNVDLFAASVLRRYVAVHGHEPEWNRGHVYRGVADWMLFREVYEDEIPALAEQVEFEIGAGR